MITTILSTATNAEKSVCPMTASYRLKGPIGPPYMSSRHKRNHHDHHQHYHHRHGVLSFRGGEGNPSTEEMWRFEGRPLVLRHRRSVTPQITDATVDELELLQRAKRQNQGCMIDYNSVRRLKIGCTQQTIIDVNPSCSDEGEEGEIYFITK